MAEKSSFPTTTRVCYSCDERKLLVDFVKNSKSSPDPYRNLCKRCHADATRRRFLANPERRRLSSLTYISNHQEYYREYRRKYYQEHGKEREKKRVQDNPHLWRDYARAQRRRQLKAEQEAAAS